jgi:hypothetical protein
MPKREYRKEIGEFYNEVQEASNQIQDARSTQQRLNSIADNAGRPSTQGNISRVHAMLQTASLLFSLVPTPQNRVQEPSVGSSNSVRQKRNEPSMPPPDLGAVPSSSPGRQSVPIGKRIRKQTTPTLKQFTDLQNKALASSQSQMTTPLPSATTIDPEAVLLKQLDEDIKNNQFPTKRYPHELPAFYYDNRLFQNREETSKVNQKLKTFFIKEKLAADATSDHELIEIAQKWLEKEPKKEAYEVSGREQFFAYTLLNGYGAENERLGDFIFYNEWQAIFTQWKTNTLLKGYEYKNSTDEKKPHKLSLQENYSITKLKEYKKESEQIFSDFIHKRTPSISNKQPIELLFYDYDFFEARGKTEKVNGAITSFLKANHVSLDESSPSELVRKMQEWIHAGETYPIVVTRERQAAKLLCERYGVQVKEDLPTKDARRYLLQWENNNAQTGYIYKGFRAFEVQEVEKKQSENTEKDSAISNDDSQPKQDVQLVLDETQKKNQQEAIAAFLVENGIDCKTSAPRLLIQGVTRYFLFGEGKSGVSDAEKLIQFADVLLGVTEQSPQTPLSEKTASIIVANWIQETSESLLSARTKRENKRHTLADDSVQWRNPKVMRAVTELFQQNGHLAAEATNNEVISALGKWFMQEDGRTELSVEKVQTLAKVILKEMELYGGKPEENISNEDAEKTVMKWTFENVLNSSIEEYLVKEILASTDPSNFKISDLKEGLEHAANTYIPFTPHDHEYAFKIVWTKFLDKALPNYLYQSNVLAQDLFVSDYGAVTQLMGERLLANEESRADFSQSEVRTLGAFFLNTTIGKEKRSLEEIQQIMLPALLATAQLEPELLRESLKNGNYQEVALNIFTSYWRKGYFKAMDSYETLHPLMTSYQWQLQNWHSKRELGWIVMKECHKRGIPMEILQFPRVIPGVPIPIDLVIGVNALDGYLQGINPCPGVDWNPPNLEEWYTNLTKAVADSYFPLDKKLIELAFESLDSNESDYIFSPETHINKFNVELRRIREEHEESLFNPADEHDILKINKETELFAATQGKERRVYALKKVAGVYKIYRVDNNLKLYLDYGLFDQEYIQKTNGRYKDGGLVIDNGKRHPFNTYEPVFLTYKGGKHYPNHQHLASDIGLRNREQLYNQLYESGNDKSAAAQTFDVLKHTIPFYDCVAESIDGNAAEAVSACLLDTVFLLPVAGEAVGLGAKFGAGVSRAFVKGGMRAVLKNGRYFLPTSTELTKLGISTLRYIDPGLELITDGGRLAIRGLTKLKNHRASAAEQVVLDKLKKMETETPAAPEAFKRAHLPENGPEVPIKRIRDHLYVQMNEKTGAGFGHYLVLKGNQLEVFKKAPPFTKRQQQLIQYLETKEEQFRVFEDVLNSSPKAYGEGMIRKVTKDGEPPQYFIKMKNHWVPVRETKIKGKEPSVRYDVCTVKRVLPVNYNGAEWYFEAGISPLLGKKTAKEIRKKINEFDYLKDPSSLSAPDEKSLMWDESGKSYIKVNNYYVPLVPLDKEINLYQLVSKTGNEPMTVLRFEPESGQFKLETPREKELRQHNTQEKEPSNDEKDLSAAESMVLCGGATSRLRKSNVQNNAPKKIPRKKRTGKKKAYNTLPKTPDRSTEWNAIRKATVYKKPPARRENLLVRLPKLKKFIPEPANTILPNPETDRMILEIIEQRMFNPSIPLPNFWVFAGLDSKKMPKFIQSFQTELAEGFQNAKTIFGDVTKKCEALLKQPSLSATEEGQYLTQMFQLENEQDKEEVLKEIAQRLLSMSKKGEEFLQKTEEFGFENIWIVSSKLKLDPKSKRYLTTIEQDPQMKAFVFPTDAECRIVIIADAYRRDPKLSSILQLNTKTEETLLHETTHLVSGTEDLALYDLPKKGFDRSGEEILDYYDLTLNKRSKKKDFDLFVRQLAEHSKLNELSTHTVYRALSRDPMLRANVQMMDATMVSVIMRDIAHGRAFDAQVRVRRNADVQQADTQKAEMGAELMSLALASANKFDFIKEWEMSQEKERTAAAIPDLGTIWESTGENREEGGAVETSEKKSLFSVTLKGKEESAARSKMILNQRLQNNNKKLNLRH